MESSEGPRRRYGDKEVGLILKRAAELQRLEPSASAEGSGLSLSDLEEIAAEAGINPQHLRRAAEELDTGSVDPHAEGMARWIGAPLANEFERTLSGELQDDEFEVLVPEIQRTAEGHGQASLLGRTLTWQSTSPNSVRSLQVIVTARGGRTRIRIEERYNQLAGQIFGGFLGGGGGGVGVGVGVGVGIGALGSAAFAIAFPIGAVAVAYMAARTMFSSIVGRRRRTLRDLLDRLTERVEDAMHDRALAESDLTKQRRLPGA